MALVGYVSGGAVFATLTFYLCVDDVEVSIRAVADGCASDEFMLGCCLAEESNEGNNNLVQYR